MHAGVGRRYEQQLNLPMGYEHLFWVLPGRESHLYAERANTGDLMRKYIYR